VLAAIDSDLNTPAALARLHVLASDLETATTAAERGQAKARLLASAEPLGLLQDDPMTALAGLRPASVPALTVADIEALVAQRRHARQSRDFARADALREQLARAGITVQDGLDGSTWSAATEPTS